MLLLAASVSLLLAFAPARSLAQAEVAAATGLTTEELALLEEMQRLVEEFDQQTQAYRRELQSLVEQQYQQRRSVVESAYEKAISELEQGERARRENAIARFEAFLRRYPNDRAYTPDAMFRLAELYFEKSHDEYLSSTKVYDKAVVAYDRGELEEEPAPPEPHFEKSIALYQRMITDFEDYRLIDGAYYLLGYCLSEQGEVDAALETFLKLATGYPQSRFYTEAWMRVGEFYFDSDRLEEAIDAYSRVVKAGSESKLYDKGLYKLAWTHYRLDLFDQAITEFMTLVDFADAQKELGNMQAQSLRPESIQYIAISFADERWDRGIGYDFEADETGQQMVRFALQYFERVGHRSYEKEVISRLGGILFDSTKYQGAVDALNHTIAMDPMAADAPELQQKIVEAWERARQFDLAAAARDVLFKQYSEESQWFQANQANSEARRKAAELAKTSLYSSAIFYHRQAQKYWADQRLDLAKGEYGKAAEAYQGYLDRFPHDKNAYELRFYLADCYFYSLNFNQAATVYAAVRDSTEGTKYQIDAALGVFYAVDEEIKRLERAGKLEERKILGGAKQGEALPQAEEIPAIRKSLADACDAFVAVAPGHERVPALMYKSAEIYYVYHHYDEARRRFEAIIDKYPTEEVAKYAANLIIDVLLAKQAWAEVEQFSRYVQEKKIGDKEEYKTFELGALFNKAKEYLAQGQTLLEEGKTDEGNAKLEEGAREYVRLVTENPKHEFADKALYNAAVAFERVRRFDSAGQLYERVFREYPSSDLADEALFQVAVKAEQAFDFDKAVRNYLKLVKEYKESPDRANAQFNAALALENTQHYQEAAQEYKRYAVMFPEREDAPESYFRAGVVQEKQGDKVAMIKTFTEFIDKYKRDNNQGDRLIEGLVKIGDHYAETKKTREAKTFYERAVKEFKARGLPNNSVAGYQAAKARFNLIETELGSYVALMISGNGKKQQAALKAKAERLKQMEDLYREILDYKQIEWSLAALYRLGYLYENFAETILKAECPQDIRKMGQEYCDEYIILLEDQAAKLEEKIVPAYEIAYREARKAKVVNQWTKLTLEGLNKYRKAEYPIDKEPRRRLVSHMGSGAGVVVPEEIAGKLDKGPRLEGK